MKAKRHALLAEITSALEGRLPEDRVEILGHKYLIRLLKPEGEDWAASRTDGSSLAASLLNARKPSVAAAIIAIDEVPVEKLFEPGADMELALREMLASNARALRDWRRSEVLEWLSEEMDPYVLETLYSAYSKMASKHREAMRGLENLAQRTPSLA